MKIKAGDRFNKLIAISPAPCTPHSAAARWHFQCDCGNQTIAAVYKVIHGNIKACGCLKGKQRLYSPEHSSARHIWRTNYDDGLSFEEFLAITQMPCNYCNASPSNSFTAVYRGSVQGTFNYSGLDRIDSSKNHTLDNVVACCKTCNRMKSDMSMIDFIQHIEKICSYLSGKTIPTFPT
jgi:hypothetical protein